MRERCVCKERRDDKDDLNTRKKAHLRSRREGKTLRRGAEFGYNRKRLMERAIEILVRIALDRCAELA